MPSQSPSNGAGHNRRTFLQRAASGAFGLAALPPHALLAQTSSPRPQPQVVPGVHGYSLEKSVVAGREIAFCISNSVPCRLSIWRLGDEVDDPSGDELLHRFDQTAPNPQAIHPGSYVRVAKGLTGPLGPFSLECWVRPWRVDRWMGLITQHDYPLRCGLGLFLHPEGRLVFYVGDGGAYNAAFSHQSEPGTIQQGAWHHLVATWSGRQSILWVNGRIVGSRDRQAPRAGTRPGPEPIRLGAYAERGTPTHILDGDLAMPVIHGEALEETAIQRRFEKGALQPGRGPGVLACWPLDEEQGSQVRDRSPHQRHGEIVNHATWMIGGPSFKANVPRFGDYNPDQDPRRGHGLRLASDDLYDCGWQVTHRYRIPAGAKPGLYVGRVRFSMEGKPRLYHITFIVRRAPSRPRPPILVLCATNTWLAYSGTPFGVTSEKLLETWGTSGTTNSPGNPPAFNLYHGHAGGQGTCQVGLRMPWPAAGPYILYGGPTRYSHLMRAERFAQVWLERAGYDFDVISDLDLHRDPGCLQDYKVLLINGHSEYWSKPMYEGLQSYLKQDGNVVCLSGNSLFWRVSFNAAGTVMECRKVDAPGHQIPPERRGECWHSQDGDRGGLMRECGYPGWALVGLETLGWNNQGDPRQFGPYHVEAEDHFLFHKPRPVNVRPGEPIGEAPDGTLPRANGHEIDVRLSTLAALQQHPSPAGAQVPPDPLGMVRLANGVIPWQIGGVALDYFLRQVKPVHPQGGEMIYWERPEGGRVFNAGSIGSGWALHADPRLQRLVKNVLHHFGVPEPETEEA